MLWLVLAMGVLTHLPIRQVFKAARRMVGGGGNAGGGGHVSSRLHRLQS
jgi:ribulose-5-phosphate 4-epimerase/fuculose-1-phosphate aldolase